jgi:hypothetical protein
VAVLGLRGTVPVEHQRRKHKELDCQGKPNERNICDWLQGIAYRQGRSKDSESYE